MFDFPVFYVRWYLSYRLFAQCEGVCVPILLPSSTVTVKQGEVCLEHLDLIVKSLLSDPTDTYWPDGGSLRKGRLRREWEGWISELVKHQGLACVTGPSSFGPEGAGGAWGLWSSLWARRHAPAGPPRRPSGSEPSAPCPPRLSSTIGDFRVQVL